MNMKNEENDKTKENIKKLERIGIIGMIFISIPLLCIMGVLCTLR